MCLGNLIRGRTGSAFACLIEHLEDELGFEFVKRFGRVCVSIFGFQTLH